jgi:hypothetical protein
MLENSVWKQYNEENNFREKLAEFCSQNIQDLIEDDKELYAVLKAKLTKKELRLFAMECGNIGEDIIKADFAYNDEELEKAKFKLFKKLKQDKIRLSFRSSSSEEY